MHHSSTSNSKSASPLKKVVITILLIAVAIAVIDQVIEYIEDEVIHDNAPILYEPLYNIGADLLWKASDAGISPIVFSGSSLMLKGLSPHQFDDQLQMQTGEQSYSINASLIGSSPLQMRDFFRYVVFPTHPRILIYGIEMRALNPDQNAKSAVIAVEKSPLGYAIAQPLPVERDVALWLVRHSGVIRYRTNVQIWFTTGLFQKSVSLTDDRGFLSDPGVLKGRERDIGGQKTLFPAPDPAQDQALRAIASDCNQFNVPCVFISMPVSQESYKYILPADDQVYQDYLKTLVTDTHIPIWNFNTPACRELLDSSMFADFTHLNPVGVAKFTTLMATLYLEQHENIAVPEGDDLDCVQMLQ